MVRRDEQIHYSAGFLFFNFLLTITRCGRHVESWWKHPRELGASNSLGRIPGCAYISCSYAQISISRTILSESPSSPISVKDLHSFCINLLHLLIIWLLISSILRYKLHLGFCWVLSIFTSTVFPYDVILRCYLKGSSFSLKISLSLPRPSFHERFGWLVAWSVHTIALLLIFCFLLIFVLLILVCFVLFLVFVISLSLLLM